MSYAGQKTRTKRKSNESIEQKGKSLIQVLEEQKEIERQHDETMAEIKVIQKRMAGRLVKNAFFNEHSIKVTSRADIEFHRLLWSGKYTYIQGYFVLKPVAHIIIQSGITISKILETDELMEAFSPYFMKRALHRIPHSPKIHYARPPRRVVMIAAPAEDSFESSDLAELKAKLKRHTKGYGDGPPDDFKALYALYTRPYSSEDLEELTGITSRTFRRIENENDARPNLRTLVAVCIAVHLSPSDSAMLINASGYRLRHTREERAYQALLEWGYMYTVPVCNEILINENIRPLSSLRKSS